MQKRFAELPVTALDVSLLDSQQRLITLWRRAYEVEANLIGVADFPPLRLSPRDFACRKGAFYAILKQSQPLGAIEVETVGDRTLLIASLIVEPTWFRRGIGRRLVSFALQQSETVLVSTSSANIPAVTLYRSMGFQLSATSTTPDGIKLSSFEYSRGGSRPPPTAS